jgi:hypothetical protein
MFIKPVAGRRIRCPVKGEYLPEYCSEVPDTLFWHRRLRDGDVERCQPETETKLTKKGIKEAE